MVLSISQDIRDELARSGAELIGLVRIHVPQAHFFTIVDNALASRQLTIASHFNSTRTLEGGSDYVVESTAHNTAINIAAAINAIVWTEYEKPCRAIPDGDLVVIIPSEKTTGFALTTDNAAGIAVSPAAAATTRTFVTGNRVRFGHEPLIRDIRLTNTSLDPVSRKTTGSRGYIKIADTGAGSAFRQMNHWFNLIGNKVEILIGTDKMDEADFVGLPPSRYFIKDIDPFTADGVREISIEDCFRKIEKTKIIGRWVHKHPLEVIHELYTRTQRTVRIAAVQINHPSDPAGTARLILPPTHNISVGEYVWTSGLSRNISYSSPVAVTAQQTDPQSTSWIQIPEPPVSGFLGTFTEVFTDDDGYTYLTDGIGLVHFGDSYRDLIDIDTLDPVVSDPDRAHFACSRYDDQVYRQQNYVQQRTNLVTLVNQIMTLTGGTWRPNIEGRYEFLRHEDTPAATRTLSAGAGTGHDIDQVEPKESIQPVNMADVRGGQNSSGGQYEIAFGDGRAIESSDQEFHASIGTKWSNAVAEIEATSSTIDITEYLRRYALSRATVQTAAIGLTSATTGLVGTWFMGYTTGEGDETIDYSASTQAQLTHNVAPFASEMTVGTPASSEQTAVGFAAGDIFDQFPDSQWVNYYELQAGANRLLVRARGSEVAVSGDSSIASRLHVSSIVVGGFVSGSSGPRVATATFSGSGRTLPFMVGQSISTTGVWGAASMTTPYNVTSAVISAVTSSTIEYPIDAPAGALHLDGANVLITPLNSYYFVVDPTFTNTTNFLAIPPGEYTGGSLFLANQEATTFGTLNTRNITGSRRNLARPTTLNSAYDERSTASFVVKYPWRQGFAGSRYISERDNGSILYTLRNIERTGGFSINPVQYTQIPGTSLSRTRRAYLLIHGTVDDYSTEGRTHGIDGDRSPWFQLGKYIDGFDVSAPRRTADPHVDHIELVACHAATLDTSGTSEATSPHTRFGPRYVSPRNSDIVGNTTSHGVGSTFVRYHIDRSLTGGIFNFEEGRSGLATRAAMALDIGRRELSSAEENGLASNTNRVVDVTIPVEMARQRISRYRYGAPQMNVRTTLRHIDLQIGDHISVDGINDQLAIPMLGETRTASQSSIVWEVTSVEVRPFDTTPEIELGLTLKWAQDHPNYTYSVNRDRHPVVVPLGVDVRLTHLVDNDGNPLTTNLNTNNFLYKG